MREVQIEKDRLRKVVEENRTEHRQLFEEAHDAFREKLIANLESRLKAARDGGTVELYIDLVEPDDHTDDYDRVLEMLDYEVEDKITLTQSEFTQYVQDDWGWMGEFAASYTSNTTKRLPKFG